MIFDLYAVFSKFAVKGAHSLIGYFSDGSYFNVTCVCHHCHWTNQNLCLMIDLTSHLSCLSDDFSSYRVSFSLMTSLTMMVLGLGNLVPALFHFPLKIPLVVSVEYFP